MKTNGALHRLTGVFLSVFFSTMMIVVLTRQRMAARGIVRRFVIHFFGGAIASRYHEVIDFYQGRYGAALARGLDVAERVRQLPPRRALDCGIGTGFASLALLRHAGPATLVGVDAAAGMLARCRQNDWPTPGVLLTRGDTSRLPFADDTMDMVIAHNTIPFLAEFARVCRPGGVVLVADSSARWAAGAARRAAVATRAFDEVVAEQAGSGFHLVARKRAARRPSPDA